LGVIVITLLLHYAWEMGQASFFTNFWGMSILEHAWPCFKASLGDLAIAAVCYAVAATVFRRPAWAVRPGWLWPAVLWLITGLVITVVLESWALAEGRWDYEPAMPTVAGIGVLPLLQWIIIPILTLTLVRWLVRHSASQGDSA
jgi:hypothetical protein